MRRSGALVSTSQTSAAVEEASAHDAGRAQDVGHQRPVARARTRPGRNSSGAPSPRQASAAQSPISSPNICETSGAVMKSPCSASAGRVA